MRKARFYLWVWREYGTNPDEFDQLDGRVMRWLEIEAAIREAKQQAGE